MDNTSLINLKVNLTLLNFLYCLSNIHSYSATLRVRHQTTRTEYTTQRTNLTHTRRHCDDDINICPTTLNLLNVFVKTYIISACFLSSSFLIRSTECEHTSNLACSVWQSNNATNHLVSLTWINT